MTDTFGLVCKRNLGADSNAPPFLAYAVGKWLGFCNRDPIVNTKKVMDPLMGKTSQQAGSPQDDHNMTTYVTWSPFESILYLSD